MVILAGVGRYGIFLGQLAARVLPPWQIHEIAGHTWTVTSRCIVPVTATVVPLGMVMALQGLAIFDIFGAQRLLSSLISVSVFRELSPVLGSALVAAQGGSSFAAELGSMRIKEELDATSIMAVDPLRIHVLPRVVACVIATPILNLIGSVGGIIGGFITAVWVKGEPGGTYWANLWELTTPMDLAGGIIKTAVFGFIIGSIACYHGFHATGGAAGVGKAVNDTVVQACVASIVANYFLTSALFGLG